MQLLLLELGERDHARGGVDPIGVDGVAPALRLEVEIPQVCERPTEEEVAPS